MARSEFSFLFPVVKKTTVRKPRAAAVRVGTVVEIHGHTMKITGRDTRFANAWFVDGSPYSFSRDMIKVVG